MKTNPTASPARRWLIAALLIGLSGVAFAVWQGLRYRCETKLLLKNAGRPAESPASPAAPATAPAVAADDFSALALRLRAEFDQGVPAEAMMQRLSQLAERNPAMAIDLAHALGRTDAEKAAWVTDLARQWTLRAPQAAWDWLAQLTPSRLDALAEGALPATVFGAMAAHAPALLVRNVERLLRAGETGAGVSPAVAVHLGLDSLVEQGGTALAREAVERWARDPERPAMGSSAYLSVANALCADDPLAAAAWLQTMPASTDRDEALTEFSAHWAQRDPAAALRWAESLPTAELQVAAVQRTFFDWVEREAPAATQWLGDYLARTPATPESDRLIEALINLGGTVRNAPGDALQWAGLLSDATKRAAYQEKIALRWSRDDPAAASSYVWSSLAIPAERKSAVIRRLQEKKSADFEP